MDDHNRRKKSSRKVKTSRHHTRRKSQTPMKHIKIHIEQKLWKKCKSNKKIPKRKKPNKTPNVPVISVLINKSPRKKQKKIKISNSAQ